MRVLFDKNVPHAVRQFLDQQHQVETVDDRGWDRISNGELIESAEANQFDVVVTADQNIVYQQNLRGRQIALVVLGSNIWPIVRQHAESIRTQINAVKPGSYVFLEMPIPKKPQATEE